MSYCRNNLVVTPNIINCGQETIYTSVKNCFSHDLSIDEFYFLSNPNCFDYLPNRNMMGYDTLKGMIDALHKNVSENIIYCHVISNNIKKDICMQLNQGNLIIANLKDYSSYNEIDGNFYPYHLFIVHGYNDDEEVMLIDLYPNSNSNDKIRYFNLEWDFFCEHCAEYYLIQKSDLIVQRKQNMKRVIQKELDFIVDKDNGALSRINSFFLNLEKETSCYEKVGSVLIMKGLIFLPILFHTQNLFHSVLSDTEYNAIDLLIKKWTLFSAKYIKETYKGSGDLYNYLNIATIIDENRSVLDEIVHNHYNILL